MSFRDEGASRGTVNPTTTTNGGFTAPTAVAPGRHTDDSAAATGPLFDQHTERRDVDHVGTGQLTSGQPQDRRDRVRWGPVWAGTAVVLTVFIVLQLLFFALGWLDLGTNGSGVTTGIVTGILALVAFFVGGLTASASTMWRNAGDGMLHGVLVWALSVLGILGLLLIGGGALLGPLASLLSSAPGAAQGVDIDPAQALAAARHTAGWTALGLGLAVAAAALGGIAGSKIWPGRNHTGTTTSTARPVTV